jgi:tRNA (cytidine56-2'-O)-methyltransferase
VIAILRLGHRPDRDKRITTHICLVARAFGADTVYITTRDSHIEQSINGVVKRFGGDFQVISGVKAKNIITSWKGQIMHLTMYGQQLPHVLNKIPKKQDILIILGAEKVPSYYYQIADYNVSIGNQPHSEVAALAIFLDRYTTGQWIQKDFNGDITIIPSNKGKNVKMKNKEDQ